MTQSCLIFPATRPDNEIGRASMARTDSTGPSVLVTERDGKRRDDNQANDRLSNFLCPVTRRIIAASNTWRGKQGVSNFIAPNTQEMNKQADKDTDEQAAKSS